MYESTKFRTYVCEVRSITVRVVASLNYPHTSLGSNSNASGASGSSSTAAAIAPPASPAPPAGAGVFVVVTYSTSSPGVVSFKTTNPRVCAAFPLTIGTNLLSSSNLTYRSWPGVTLAGFASSSLVGSGSFFAASVSLSSPSFFFSSPPSTSIPSVASFSSPPFAASVSISTSPPPSAAVSRAFFAALALAFAVVDNTALTTLPLSFLSSAVTAGGYANKDGLQWLVTEQCGILSFASKPMNAVGTNVRDTKYDSGDQYQYCVNTIMDTTAVILGKPLRARNPIVTLRPPASTMPCAMIAPIFVIVTSRLSVMWFVSRLRNGATFASVCSTITIAIAMSAPC
mmetsp:Transcript_13933/g.50008  ORF Transcript_13933/g.50008 Transcript_13933/m.50008 type:complete len:342 (-) Transcript_13933:2212-3237(-)